MSELSHAVITRMHYPPESPVFPWRLAFYRTMVLPRLLNQTDKNFEVWVVCHPEHMAAVEELGSGIHVCGLPAFPAPFFDGRMKELDAKELEVLPQFDIQTSLDSDDLVSLDYIARIKEEVAKRPDRLLALSFQPWKLDLLTLKRYKMSERYGTHQGSMFYSLYQPDKSDYQSIMSINHIYLGVFFTDVVIVAEEGYCDFVIHGANWFTGLTPNLGEA